MNAVLKLGLIAGFSLLTSNIFAQNIGINAAGSLPNNSAGLDVDFTNKGMLVPRIALTSAIDATTISSPATSLLIYNTATAGSSPNAVTPGYYYWSGSAWTRLATVGSTGTDWTTTGNSGTNPSTNFIGTTDNTDLSIHTYNTEKMRISKSGRVGINESTPTTTLHVRTYIDGTTLTPFDGLQIVSPTASNIYGNGTFLGIEDGTSSGIMGRNAQLWNFENGFLRFGTKNIERFRIDNNGSFGFNETAPSSTITLRPFVNGPTGAQYDGIRIIHPINPSTALNGLVVGLNDTGSEAAISYYEIGDLNIKTQAGNQKFWTNNQERMRITSSGTVGIGHTAPVSTLTIQDNIGVQPGMTVTSAFFPMGTNGMFYGLDQSIQTNGRIWNYMNGDIEFGNLNGEFMRIMNNGRIGVKTSSPNYDFDVNGIGHFSTALKVNTYTLPLTDGTPNQVIKTDGSGNLSWTNSSGTVNFVDLYMPSIFTVSGGPITSSGAFNVGLSTQSANTFFAGPSSGGASTPDFRPLVAADIPLLTGYIQNNVVNNNFATGQAASFDITGNAEVSGTLEVNGNVGIGTTSPLEKLDVSAGNIKLDNGYSLKNGSGDNLIGTDPFAINIGDASYSGSLVIKTPSGPGNGILFEPISGGTDVGYFTNSGRLGLGTTTPTERLEVNGNISLDNGFAVKNSSGDNLIGTDPFAINIGDASYSGSLVIKTPSGPGNGILFEPISGGTDAGYFTNTGRLGLGTTTPTERLEVNGKVKIGAYTMPSTDGLANQVLKTNGTGTLTWSNDNGGSGTVTSVALSLPSIFTVSGSPVTTSGTLTGTLANQTANTIFAGPSSGAAAAPTFRTIVAADIPTLAGYIQNNAVGNNFGTGQAASFDITGNAEISGTLEVNGNVGIGTNAPTRILHVRDGSGGSGNGALVQIGAAVAGADPKLIYFGDASFVSIGENNADDQMELRAAKFYFNTGNIGVGTQTANSKLEVDGPIAMKVKTAQVAGTNNPDATGEYWFYTSGSGAISLPAASTCTNRMYVILNNTGATRTITTYKDLTLTNQTTILNNTSLWIVSDGTNWQQIK